MQGHTHNPYPFEATAPGENGAVQFLQDNPFSSITLNNAVTTSNQKLHLQILDSEEAPAGKPGRAGTVPVAALLPGADGSYNIRQLANGVDVTLAPGEKRQLKLGLIVRQLVPASDTNATYQALLEVTEATHGYRQLVPVVAEIPGSQLFGRNGSLMGSGGSIGKKDNTVTVAATALTRAIRTVGP